jgi:hypothetical protein
MYLSSQRPVKGDLRKILGNLTALYDNRTHLLLVTSMDCSLNVNRGITGFVISLTPLSIDLVGWRGSGKDGTSDI